LRSHDAPLFSAAFQRMSAAATPATTASPNPDHVLRLASELDGKVFQ
jgi:hypothetical protein